MRLCLYLWPIFLAFFASSALAHRLAPALLEIQEEGDGVYRTVWQQPALVPSGRSRPEPVFPEHCRPLEEVRVEPTQTPTGPAVRSIARLDCGEADLSMISIANLQSESVVLLRILFQGGRSLTQILNNKKSVFQMPEQISRSTAVRQYVLLGTEHILSGIDHLLFVFGLLLLIRSTRALIYTITAFTVGHSITLSLTVLDLIYLPQAIVEFLIALSIFWVAVQLTRPPTKSRLGNMYPIPMAVLFGFLHGMGFAGALAETGLPVKELPVALLSFNLGIEAGQLLFVFTVLILRLLWPMAARSALLRPAMIHVLGASAAFWCLERFFLIFG